VKGGTPPWRYEWSRGDTDSVIPDAVPGKYTVFITGSGGCRTAALAGPTAKYVLRQETLISVPKLYPAGLRTFVGECFDDFVKQVSVADAGMRNDGFLAESIIRSFTVSPSPNSGNFTVAVELGRVSPVRLRIVSIGTGIVMHESRYLGQQAYAVSYSLSPAAGVYAVLLETDADADLFLFFYP
jgi:hypothetical protein